MGSPAAPLRKARLRAVGTRQEFSICYVTRLLGGQIQTSAESSAVRFVSQDELPGYTIHPSIQRRIGHYLEHRPGPYIGLTG
jgi:hypothetical protein